MLIKVVGGGKVGNNIGLLHGANTIGTGEGVARAIEVPPTTELVALGSQDDGPTGIGILHIRKRKLRRDTIAALGDHLRDAVVVGDGTIVTSGLSVELGEQVKEEGVGHIVVGVAVEVVEQGGG